MTENQGVDKFEKKVLFSVVRGFSLLMGFVGLVMLVLGAVMLVKSWMSLSSQTEVKVSLHEVQQKVTAKEKAEQSQGEADSTASPDDGTVTADSPALKQRDALIDGITEMLVKDNQDLSTESVKGILLEKVANLADDKAVAYLEEMKKIVEAAPAGKKAAFTDGFIELYSTKSAQEAARIEEKRFEAMKNLGTYAYVTITGLMTVVSFGIILILAAIERNTRRAQ